MEIQGPETREISDAEIMRMYSDAVIHGKIEETGVTDPREAAQALDEAGLLKRVPSV